MSLIVTADDFGRSLAVNEAVDRACREGILNSASLMVSGSAFNDAVEKALSNPVLKTGLHVTLTETEPVSPPENVPLLLNSQGRFRKSPAVTGCLLNLNRAFRHQAQIEVEAQFAVFAKTGLDFSHVDSHHHLHLTPVLFDIIVEQSLKHGVKFIRIPYEPWEISGSVIKGNRARNWVYRKVFYPLCRSSRKKTEVAGISSAGGVFGLYSTGQLTEDRLLLLLERLRNLRGVYEVYSHPSIDPSSPGFVEFQALTSSRVRRKAEEIRNEDSLGRR